MVEVTQEDRDALCNILVIEGVARNAVLSGIADERPHVARSLAILSRHRTTALAAKEAELAAVRVRAQASAEMADDYHAAHIEQRDRANKAEAENAELRAEVERLRGDAARWRAFFGSERFYVMGAAGFDWEASAVREPRDETNWLHFTLNIWDRHPASGDDQDKQGRAMLLSYVDHLRARAALGSDRHD